MSADTYPTPRPVLLVMSFYLTPTKGCLVMWVMLTDAIYNTIHWQLHGFAMDITSGMAKWLPVLVAGYRLEPICALPKLPYTQMQHFSLVEVYTLERKTDD